MEHARSVLFTAGDAEDVRPTIESAADAVVFDLEHVHENREAVVDQVHQRVQDCVDAGKHCGVRVAGIDTANGIDDVEAFAGRDSGVEFLVVPDVRGEGEVQLVADVLDEHGSDLQLLPLVENPSAVFHAYEIAHASPRVCGLGFGPSDFRRSMGLSVLTEADFTLPRYLVSMAAASASVRAFDMPTFAIEDDERTATEAAEAKTYGFDGKIVMTPGQAEIVNRAFEPSEEELAEARKIVREFEQTEGSVVVDGRPMGEGRVAELRELIETADARAEGRGEDRADRA